MRERVNAGMDDTRCCDAAEIMSKRTVAARSNLKAHLDVTVRDL
jgi:hypothetical protein